MLRRRSVSGRSIWNVSAMSWPCAHVSMTRAERNERAPIGGPNQGTRARSSTVSAAARSLALARRHHSSNSSGVIERPRVEMLAHRVVSGDECIGCRLRQRDEGFGILERQSCRVVEESQVAYLVADSPSGSGRLLDPTRDPRAVPRSHRAASCSARRSASICSSPGDAVTLQTVSGRDPKVR